MNAHAKSGTGGARATNPILAGDYPDPSIVRAGRDYYLTHSSFNYAPGLLIWHSRDLLNWRPVCNALREFDGDVWAPELVRHGGRWHIYYPAQGSNHVITAPDIAGPWSRPVDLKVGWIDPGHAVGPDGKRYLHLSSGMAAELAPDGLSLLEPPRQVYAGWPIPADWSVEGFCLEGPKIFRRGEWYYLLAAEGGTAGPATSHMVVAARAKHPMGPWENSPHNPLVHTESRAERWWSVGHGTVFDTLAGDWWMMLHGYERGYHTLGRQTLMTPIRWTRDGWPAMPRGFRPDRTLPARAARAAAHGPALSDPLCGPELGLHWRWWLGPERRRFAFVRGGLRVNGKGAGPADCAPLVCMASHHAYEIEVDVELRGGARAGLTLFYSPACFLGLGLRQDSCDLVSHQRQWSLLPGDFRRARLRLRNDRHEVSLAIRPHSGSWRKILDTFETSGYHHNVFGGFLSLRPALWCSGGGAAVFRDFRYRPLP